MAQRAIGPSAIACSVIMIPTALLTRTYLNTPYSTLVVKSDAKLVICTSNNPLGEAWMDFLSTSGIVSKIIKIHSVEYAVIENYNIPQKTTKAQ